MQDPNSPKIVSTEYRRAIARLLIVRLSAMGDVLHALPAVAALRSALPETQFGWVVEERWADLVRSVVVNTDASRRPIVDRVHTVSLKSWRRSLLSLSTLQEITLAIKELRAASYDVAADFQGAARSSLVAQLSGAPTIYGFAEPRENVASMFYTTTVLPKEKHVIQQNLSLAAAIVAHSVTPPDIEFAPATTATVIAPRSGNGYVVINPGAGWGAKLWPPERYGEVAKCMAGNFGLECLVNIGPGEDTLMAALQRTSGEAARRISCSPAELINVVRGARFVLGGDTGPLHLAAALGVPVVAVYGPTDPARTGPLGTRSIVLRSPNSRTTLSHERSADRAMLDISVDDVLRAAAELLREPA